MVNDANVDSESLRFGPGVQGVAHGHGHGHFTDEVEPLRLCIDCTGLYSVHACS
jgi:hypothetical protein